MNEDLWLTSDDPLELLGELYPMRTLGSVQHQTRKCRMYFIACARRKWDRLPGVFRALVGLAEIYAESPREREWLRKEVAPIAEQLLHSDGGPSDFQEAYFELEAACHLSVDFGRALRRLPSPIDAPPDPPLSLAEWRGLSALVFLPFDPNTPQFRWAPRELHDCDLLREVHGNPCRHFSFDADWRTSTAFTMARQMYESREFSAMPILADALQDAGCDNDDMLNHCRETPEHVRGCWVLDLVLDKK